VLRDLCLEPIVTLHHFTNPVWFNRLGAWENKKARKFFLRFVRKVVERLSGQVKYWITLNEPMVYIYQGYLTGFWPPHKKGLWHTFSSLNSLLKTHIKAYRLIHQIYQEKNLSSPHVSIAKNLRYFSICKKNLASRLGLYLRDKWFNRIFLEEIYKHKAMDFIGVNYYTRENVKVSSFSPRNLFLETCQEKHPELEKNSLGWYIYPKGLYELLLSLKKFNLPILITENGIATENDQQRWDFIKAHLYYLSQAQQQGLKIIGYLYWSLLDNFEWDKGFCPRFGIVEVDYQTFKRTPRQSALNYKEVCQTGKLNYV